MASKKTDQEDDFKVTIKGETYLYNELPIDVQQYVQQVHVLDKSIAKLDFKRNQKVAAKTHFMNLIDEVIIKNKIDSVDT